MDECKVCANADNEYCFACDNGNQFKPMTNADRIRAMTDEELDKFLGEVQWDVANYCGGVTQKQEYPVPEKRGGLARLAETGGERR